MVCEQLKVQSQNDTAKLAEAKGLVYLKVAIRIRFLDCDGFVRLLIQNVCTSGLVRMCM